MAERLVGASMGLLVGHGVRLRGRGRVRGVVLAVGLLVTMGQSTGGTKGLVGVRSLLSGQTATTSAVLVVVGGAAGAAADGEDPEDGGSQRESDGEPGGDVDVLAHVHLDAVGLQGVSKGGSDDREENGGSDGRSSSEDETSNGEESGDAATPATADGEETDENLDNSQDEGDHVGNEHPLRDGLVNLHILVVVRRELVRDAAVGEAPDGKRVEVELSLGLGAVSGLEVAGADITVAVTHQANVVEFLDQAVGLVGLNLADDVLYFGGVDTGDVELIEDVLDFAIRFCAIGNIR